MGWGDRQVHEDLNLTKNQIEDDAKKSFGVYRPWSSPTTAS